MKAERFCELLKEQGCNLVVGVPCSILADVLHHFIMDSEVMYVPATREDEAIGIAVGAYFGGRKPMVFMQNSGLGLSINALTSLVQLYKIPMLFLITWRGYKGLDAPEHHLMGRYLNRFLKLMEIPTFTLTKKNVRKTVSRATNVMEKRKHPVALLLREGIIQ